PSSFEKSRPGRGDGRFTCEAPLPVAGFRIMLLSFGVFIGGLSMSAAIAAVKIGGDLVAGALLAAGFQHGKLLLLARMQGFEGTETALFGIPLLATGFQPGLGLRDDTIL